MATLSKVLARASLEDSPGRSGTPTPVSTFAQHRGGITQLLVIERDRVVSVDRQRVAIEWNPLTTDELGRYDLDPGGLVHSVVATHAHGLAYVAIAGTTLSVRTLADQRVLAQLTLEGTPAVTFAICKRDLSLVMIANHEDLEVYDLQTGAKLKRVEVETHEPEVRGMRAVGDQVYVDFFHVGMDMYPTDDARLYDFTLEYAWRPSPPEVRADKVRVARIGNTARITLADGRPLPDLVAHGSPLNAAVWLPDDSLLTADEAGTICRWQINTDAGALQLAQHAKPITQVRFAGDAVVSLSETDTKLWRDGALVATLPKLTTLFVDEPAGCMIDFATNEVRFYSLLDGSSGRGHTTRFNHVPTVSQRARLSVTAESVWPVGIVSLADPQKRWLPLAFADILSSTAPTIVHAGRLLLSQYTKPTRSLDLQTFEVVAERELHQNGTCWMALHPDGETLYSAGYADGRVAAWDFLTLERKQHWKVFGDSQGGQAGALLPKHDLVLVAGRTSIRRVFVGRGDGVVRRFMRSVTDCPLEGNVLMLVPDAAEERVVALMEHSEPRVLDVESMQWVEPRDGEIEAARTHRSKVLPNATAHGFENAVRSGDWIVGWTRALAIAPRAHTADKNVRAPFPLAEVGSRDRLRNLLVDDVRDEVWALGDNGMLARASVAVDKPAEVVLTIPEAKWLHWAGLGTLVVGDQQGSLHYVRTTGERICTIEKFVTAPHLPLLLTESFAASAQNDGSVWIHTVADNTFTRLLHPRHENAFVKALAVAPPFVAVVYGGTTVARWDLRTKRPAGQWTAATTLTAVDVRADGMLLVGEQSGIVTLLS